MPKLTKRGRVVLLYAPAALALLSLLVWISSRLWWTGSGYCIGTLSSCFHQVGDLFSPLLTGKGESRPIT